MRRQTPFRTCDELVAAAVRRAWLRYLDDTRAAAPGEYEDVEEREWRRLVRSLQVAGEPVPQPHAGYGDVYAAVSE